MRTKHAAGWNVARKHTTARKMLELAGNGGTVKCMKVRRTNKTWIPNQIKERVCHTLPEIYNFFFGPLGADKLIRDELVLSGVINSEDPVDVVDGQLAIPADA